MKSEHRHELQTNELGRFAEQFLAYFEKNLNLITVVVCAASLLAAGLIYWAKSSRTKNVGAWRDLASAQNAEDYADVWQSHAGTAAAQWARLREGELRLGEGVQLLFSNVESAQKELQRARDVLQAAYDDKSAPAELRERAIFNLARTMEALSDGNESDAVQAYRNLLREFPGSIFKRDAEQRIAALESGSGQEFYAWFAKYPRPKPLPKRPRDQLHGEATGDDLMQDLDEGIPVDSRESNPADESPLELKTGPALDLPTVPAPGEESSGKPHPSAETSDPATP